jgi:transposase
MPSPTGPHRELKRKHVTLQVLWDEYIERCPAGYRYSRFCELYRGWASRLSVTPEPYSFGEWCVRRVGVDYHVEVEAHF